MADPVPVPSTPDPNWAAVAFTLARAALLLLSAAGVYHGTISDSMLQIIVYAIVAVGSALWGVYDQIQSARKAHLGAVISAETRIPQKIL